MEIDTRLGRFGDLLDHAPQHRETLQAIRGLVEEIAPDATEVASAREGSVWWGVGPRKMSDGFAWCMPHNAHVNLGFFEGTSLPDPEACLEGTGKALRHVRLHATEDVRDLAIRALLQAAFDLARQGQNA